MARASARPVAQPFRCVLFPVWAHYLSGFGFRYAHGHTGAHGTADADAGSWGLRVRNAVGSILGGLPGNAIAYVANQTVKVVANGCRGVHSENDRKLLRIGCVLAGAAGWRHTSVPRRESLNPG